jgi:hypothetical protein
MFKIFKWTGVMLGVLAGTCLASHRAKLRCEGLPDSTGMRGDVRQPDTRLDAGGQSA